MIPLAPSRKTSKLLWQITGTYNDCLAHQKFAVFAVVSSLLVPNAVKLFRRALEREHWERLREFRQSAPERELQRNKKDSLRLNKRIDKLCRIAEDIWQFPDNSCTARNISASRPPFNAPHWTGEPRPFGARRVRLQSNFPSAGYLTELVKDFAYEGKAAYAATSRAHEFWRNIPDRRQNGCKNMDNEGIDSSHVVGPHSYHQASPTLNTTTGGGHKKEKVAAAIAKHSWDDKHSTAVFEIVYMRREPFLVSASFGLKLKTVYRYCTHVRADLKRNNAPTEPSKTRKVRAKNSKSFVLKEGVLIDA